ncbi:GNAT family N-acetyltransferase [Sphingomonas sp. LB-2]|uniref:GNAT family N-acetyltransferase n=1 Tax=Sphingomonas caeni TaxID=2984949 RepID=UPI0022303F03|nr:GNAT family N-acetyltransferase [Sphingomonas caeni]MCW3846297.1 GNAT family N-acetyltransferase [Sphingomonas caeni]
MISYRDAVPADGPELDAMAQKIWLETFEHSAPPENIAAYLAHAYGPHGPLIRELGDPERRTHLALDEGRIVGYTKLIPPWLPDAEPGARQLSQIYVASSHHGLGIAQVLMDWTIAAARAAGASALLLTVWENNHRARRFYDRLGFVHIGDYGFPVGDQIDTDHIMRLAL